MLIINAHIIPVEGSELENGFLRFADGKITEMGSMDGLSFLEGEEFYNAEGRSLYPGFIDAHCHLGMWEDGLGFEGDDGNEESDPSTPQLRAVDAVNPMDRCFGEAARGGVTTVLTGPGSANPIGGQWVAMKTSGRRIDDMLLTDNAGMKFALGENPKTVYHDKNLAPNTRMATAAIIREQLKKAQRYMKDLEDAAVDEELDEPEYDSKCEALLPVLRREKKAFIHCHRADDIFTAIRIGREFNLDYVIVHCTEGWMVADMLQEEGVQAICGPILCDRSKPELRNLNVGGMAEMHRKGMEMALCTDHPVIPIQYLPLCAGIAVGAGLPWEEALKSITINAARIAGIDSRVGSLVPGKDADFSLYSADPFLPYSKPDKVFILGKEVF
ncbi:MAG: amidohydrolase [Oscillospiraceae bacterium]|nr:amidohydrolase [Oscillospiraceae bacterium]